MNVHVSPASLVKPRPISPAARIHPRADRRPVRVKAAATPGPDPIFAAIERFRDALAQYRKADRKYQRFVKNFPEIARRPRAFYCNGMSIVAGKPVSCPVYVHTDQEIDLRCDERVRHLDAVFSRAGLEQEIAAAKQSHDDLKLALAADAKALKARQDASGYTAAQTARHDALMNAALLQSEAFVGTKPQTFAGALALLKLIEDAVRRAALADDPHDLAQASPYQIGRALRAASAKLAEARPR